MHLTQLTRIRQVDGSGEGDTVEREAMYEALSNTRRRYAIHYLLQQGDTADLTDLSRRLAAWENGVPVEQVTSKQRKRVYTALRQVHLPKLDDYGLVSFDHDRGRVEPTAATTEVEWYLRIVPENEIPWSSFYVGLGLVFGSLSLLGWVGLFPFSAIHGYAWGIGTGSAVVATGVAHVLSDRRHRIGGDGPPPGC